MTGNLSKMASKILRLQIFAGFLPAFSLAACFVSSCSFCAQYRQSPDDITLCSCAVAFGAAASRISSSSHVRICLDIHSPNPRQTASDCSIGT